MPAIPATWEAKPGESLEPRRERLQWAEILPLHSSLGNKSETLSHKEKKLERKKSNWKDVGLNPTYHLLYSQVPYNAILVNDNI